jgi:hypothetical protein
MFGMGTVEEIIWTASYCTHCVRPLQVVARFNGYDLGFLCVKILPPHVHVVHGKEKNGQCRIRSSLKKWKPFEAGFE